MFLSNFLGFGAMVLQFVAHYAVIRLTKWIATQVIDIVANKPAPKVADFYNIDATIQTTPSDTAVVDTNLPESNTISKSVSTLSVE